MNIHFSNMGGQGATSFPKLRAYHFFVFCGHSYFASAFIKLWLISHGSLVHFCCSCSPLKRFVALYIGFPIPNIVCFALTLNYILLCGWIGSNQLGRCEYACSSSAHRLLYLLFLHSYSMCEDIYDMLLACVWRDI